MTEDQLKAIEQELDATGVLRYQVAKLLIAELREARAVARRYFRETWEGYDCDIWGREINDEMEANPWLKEGNDD